MGDNKDKEEPSKIKEEIDLHDFVVSLTVLSRMPPENKIKCNHNHGHSK